MVILYKLFIEFTVHVLWGYELSISGYDILVISPSPIVSLNLLHWFKLESIPCLHFVYYLPIFMLGLYSFLFAATIQSFSVKDYWYGWF